MPNMVHKLWKRTGSIGSPDITVLHAIFSKFRRHHIQCENYYTFPRNPVSGYPLTVWIHEWRDTVEEKVIQYTIIVAFQNRISPTCKFEELNAPSLPMTYQA
jgi:hypothetical protein